MTMFTLKKKVKRKNTGFKKTDTETVNKHYFRYQYSKDGLDLLLEKLWIRDKID